METQITIITPFEKLTWQLLILALNSFMTEDSVI